MRDIAAANFLAHSHVRHLVDRADRCEIASRRKTRVVRSAADE
jgi:hypothetical protein